MGLLFHRSASTRRPLASATAALRAPSPSRGRHGAEFLTELLDFEGAVDLAKALEVTAARASSRPAPLLPAPPTPDSPRAAGPDGPAALATAALARAQRRLTDIEALARRPLHDPQGGTTLVSEARIARALERAGVPAARQRKAIATAAAELFAPVEARTLQRIVSLQQMVLEVREEMAPAMTALGPVAARLEQLDAALTRATAARSSALFVRATAALGDGFAAELERAVLALPRPCPELPLALWTGAGGFVSAHLAQCEALAVASFVHQRARLDMLVQSTLVPSEGRA